MALEIDFSFKGITIPKAYINVNYISGSKDGLHANVNVYANSEEASPVCTFSTNIPGTSLHHDSGSSDKNYTKQVYEFMKSTVFVTSTGDELNLTTAINV